MTKFSLRHAAFALAALPMTLGLAACGDKNNAATGETSAPLPKVAPPAGKTWGDVVSKTPEGGYRMGNPDAPIKLVEFASLTCPHCADFTHASSAEMRDDFVASGRVSFEFRNFVRDPLDLTTAVLTRCGTPESFFALTDQAMGNQSAMFNKAQAAGQEKLEAATKVAPDKRGAAIADLVGLTDFFASRGISRDQQAACLAKTADVEALAKQTEADTTQFQITGTPTFVINGTKVDGNTWAEIKGRLQALGAR